MKIPNPHMISIISDHQSEWWVDCVCWRVWDCEDLGTHTKFMLKEFKVLSGLIDDLQLSPDGMRIVACGEVNGKTFVRAFMWVCFLFRILFLIIFVLISDENLVNHIVVLRGHWFITNCFCKTRMQILVMLIWNSVSISHLNELLFIFPLFSLTSWRFPWIWNLLVHHFPKYPICLLL